MPKAPGVYPIRSLLLPFALSGAMEKPSVEGCSGTEYHDLTTINNAFLAWAKEREGEHPFIGVRLEPATGSQECPEAGSIPVAWLLRGFFDTTKQPLPEAWDALESLSRHILQSLGGAGSIVIITFEQSIVSLQLDPDQS